MKTFIKFNDFENIKIAVIDSATCFIVTKNNKTFYVRIPSELSYSIESDGINLFCSEKENFPILAAVEKNLLTKKLLKTSYFKKKIIFKGLGLKITYDNLKRELTFKLGFSHLINFSVPSYIKNIVIKKNMLTLESTDSILLGNFAQNIYNLKEADIYKGKGFSFPYKAQILKPIKKK